MKLTAFILALTVALLFSAVAGTLLVNVATANFMASLPEIVIHSDGSIVPETEFIIKSGSVYSLAADLQQKYAITIQCSNIVFDGEGHLINGSVSYAGYANIGLALDNASNVTIKNVNVFGFGKPDIALEECVQCSVLNVNAEFLGVWGGVDNEVAGNNIGELQLEATEKNTITRNSITDILIVENSNDTLVTNNNIYRIFFRDNNDGNTFVKNNFWCGKGDPYARNFFEFDGTNFWDNGSLGNYWFDYDGKDANLNGIGDTPYLIKTKVYDKPTDKVVEIAIAQDNCPLMVPYVVHSSPSTEQQPELEPFPTVPVLAAFVIVVVIVVAGLLVYTKKHEAGLT
jgi:hypothetical protein